jgi:hypothetical protein
MLQRAGTVTLVGPLGLTGGALAALILFLIWPQAGLRVQDRGGCLLFLPVREGEPVELSWRHSVDGILVRDRFTNRGGVLTLTGSQQPFFAAGLGEIQGRGRVVGTGGHGLAILDMDEPIPRLPLRVGVTEVAHSLRHRGLVHDLSRDYARRRVELSVDDGPRLWSWLTCPRRLPMGTSP